MSIESLNSVPIFFVYIGTIVFIMLSFEVGYQISKYVQMHCKNKVDASQEPMVGGMLAMLAFVLAFTFSMSASRFDIRKQNVLEEANIINTAYLRADFLAQPHRAEVKRLLREYVVVRLQATEKNKLEIALTKSLQLHELLWSEVTTAVEKNPTRLNSLLVQSINEIIDIHEKRLNAATRDRIPDSIWLMLFAITAFAMITMGSQTGLMKTRRLIQVIPTILAFSALITLIVDLDRPSELGLIKVDQQSMIELQKNLDRAR